MAIDTSDKIRQQLKTIKVDLQHYIEKRIELMAISVGEESARSLAKVLHKAAGIFFLLGAFFFLLIALALFLGALLHSRSLGFVLVAAPFLIAGSLFYWLKPPMFTQKLEAVFDKKLLQSLNIEQPDSKKKITSDSHQKRIKHE